jgi:hypothetical protein
MKTKDWFSRFDLLRLRRQSTALLLVNLFLGAFAAHAQSTFNNTGSAWSTPGNWTPGVVPNAPGATAIFNVPLPGPTLKSVSLTPGGHRPLPWTHRRHAANQ